jgi:hypothetical protein
LDEGIRKYLSFGDPNSARNAPVIDLQKKRPHLDDVSPWRKKMWGSHWPTFKLWTVIGRPGTPASDISGFSWQFGHNIHIPTYSQLFPVQMQILVLQQCCFGIEQILSA